MDTRTIRQGIDDIESAADKAVDAVKTGTVDESVRQAVHELHQQARTKRSLDGHAELQQAVLDIEQCADRALHACRNAGHIDAELQQAVQDVHEKASRLKHSLQDAPA